MKRAMIRGHLTYASPFFLTIFGMPVCPTGWLPFFFLLLEKIDQTAVLTLFLQVSSSEFPTNLSGRHFFSFGGSKRLELAALSVIFPVGFNRLGNKTKRQETYIAPAFEGLCKKTGLTLCCKFEVWKIVLYESAIARIFAGILICLCEPV